MSSLTLSMVVVVLILIFPYNNVYGDEQIQEPCLTRCGVHNISHPFRLKDSPENCGDRRYNLSCEDNNQLILYHKFEEHHGKYYVQSINYNNFTIRLLDFNNLGYSNYSLLPPHPLGLYNFTSRYYYGRSFPYSVYRDSSDSKLLARPMLYVRCPNHVQPSGIYFDAACINNISSYANQGNNYIGYGYDKSLSELGIGDGCRIEFMYLTSLSLRDHDGHSGSNNISCSDIRPMMYYGFELSWIDGLCKDGWYIKVDQYNHTHCARPGYLFFWPMVVGYYSIYIIVNLKLDWSLRPSSDDQDIQASSRRA
ncbi:hypothetical protein P8452_06709 [Trifolium repens]|nr:hypothetical protein P8452_06709 [Trifolium repens]